MTLIIILTITIVLLTIALIFESRELNNKIEWWRQAALDANAKLRRNT